jgi:hypothetical protein
MVGMERFLFVDLAGLTPGKPFAGFAAGSFVDMNGREVEFAAGTLRTFIANTLRAIAAAKSKGMPGLPIDARAHDKGEAAGWIVGAEAGEVEDSAGTAVPVIMLAAEWTKLGLELLRDRIMANFSPTVDVRGKVIRGGSLTNWPASVDASGAPLFPAVELAQGMWAWGARMEMAEKSLDERAQGVRDAWWGLFAKEDGPQMWVVEVFEEHLVANVAGQFFRVAYAQDEAGNYGFVPQEEWVEVEKTWVEMEIGRALTEAELGVLPGGAAMVSGGGSGETGREGKEDEGVDMNMTKEELVELVGAQVRAELAAVVQQSAQAPALPAVSPATGASEFDVLKFLEMSEATDEVVGAFKTQMLEQYELMKKRATVEAAEMIGRIRRESDIAEFAQQVTGGTPDVPYGLPVSVDDLKEFLGRLQPTDLEFAKKLLGDIQTHGRQKFAELGHGKAGQAGGVALPAVYAQKLERGELTLADLGAPELALGDLAQYDLSRWNGGK